MAYEDAFKSRNTQILMLSNSIHSAILERDKQVLQTIALLENRPAPEERHPSWMGRNAEATNDQICIMLRGLIGLLETK